MFRSTLHPSNALPNPYYWAGNEPDILHPWLFVFGGRPDLTQKWTRWVAQHKCHGVGCPCSALHRYNTKPDGIPGNDDYGTLSAWLVFSGVGIYPLAGTPLYLIGSPSAPALNISLPTGVLQIRTEGWTEKAVYVSRVMLNDQALAVPAVRHEQIAHGATLTFTMQDTPSKWGADVNWTATFPDVASTWATK